MFGRWTSLSSRDTDASKRYVEILAGTLSGTLFGTFSGTGVEGEIGLGWIGLSSIAQRRRSAQTGEIRVTLGRWDGRSRRGRAIGLKVGWGSSPQESGWPGVLASRDR